MKRYLDWVPFVLFVALVWIITGCQPTEPPIKPTRDNPTFNLTVTFGTVREIANQCEALGVNEYVRSNVARGCTKFYLDENRCEVFVPRPETVDDRHTTVLGHEVLHCVAGKYHQ